MRLPALSLCSVLLALTGCHVEEGSGHLEEQIRHLESFDRVTISGDVDHVWIERCDGCDPMVRVRGDDNLIGDVDTVVRGSRLDIETEGWLIPDLPLEVAVRGPATTRIEVSGDAIVTVDGVNPSRFDALVSGSGDLGLRGEVAHFEATVSGSGAVRGFELKATDADVSVSGSGRVEVCARGRLDASVSGSGRITYDCTPASVGRNVSGSGAIRGR